MKIETSAQLVTVYVNSTDQWQGQPLYAAIVQLCKDRGMAGAIVLRGAEGFGSGGRTHTSRLLEVAENLPVKIEIVDIAERVEPLLAALGDMITEGLVTVTEVRAIRYLRDPGPQ